MLLYVTSVILCVLLWKLMLRLKSSWTSYSAIAKALSNGPLPEEHHWFYGIAHLAHDSESYITTCYKNVEKFHHKWMATWLTWYRPALVVVHPGPMKTVLQASHLCAPKSSEYGFFGPWLGDGLLVSNGWKWERSRRLLTPAFHFDILKPYVMKYNAAAEILLGKISSLGTGDQSVDICPLVSRATLDVLLRCALSYVDEGIQSTDRNQHPYCQAVSTLKEIYVKRWLDPLSHNDFIFSLKSDYKKQKSACNYAHGFSSNLIWLRRKSLEKDPAQLAKRHLDFLDILLTAKDENGEGMTDEEIRNEVDTFVFAGHDTTASAIMWALHSLAKYPRMQQRVREEVNDVLGERTDLDYDDLSKLHYTTCFIKESMRMTPPVPAVNRTLKEPVTVEGVTFPAETIVDIVTYCMHHHPDVWENHNEFDPDRFLPENIDKKDPFAFLPFSAGQRNCIGQHFAMNEVRVIISSVVKRFQINLDKNRDAIPFKELVTGAKDGIYLHFRDLSV